MASTAATFCFMALTVTLSKGILDTYVWHYTFIDDCVRNVANSGFAYSKEKDTLLGSYTGDKATACKEQLNKEQWYGNEYGGLQAMLYNVNGEGKKIDTTTYDKVQKCRGDKTCENKALDSSKKQLEEFNDSSNSKIDQFEKDALSQIKNYLDKCIGK